MKIAERIRQQRKLIKMSQEELSSLTGVSLKTVQRWEADERTPRIEIVPKLAEALSTSAEYLMGLRDNPTSMETNEQVLKALALSEKVSNENTELTTPFSAGMTNNMLIFKNGEQEVQVPNDEEGRKLFLLILQNSLKNMGFNAVPSSPNSVTNNGTNSKYTKSNVNFGAVQAETTA